MTEHAAVDRIHFRPRDVPPPGTLGFNNTRGNNAFGVPQVFAGNSGTSADRQKAHSNRDTPLALPNTNPAEKPVSSMVVTIFKSSSANADVGSVSVDFSATPTANHLISAELILGPSTGLDPETDDDCALLVYKTEQDAQGNDVITLLGASCAYIGSTDNS